MGRLFTGVLMLGLSLGGWAAPILQSTTPISGATNTLTFEEIAPAPNATPVTNQYAAFGITFSGTSDGTASGVYMNTQGAGFYDGVPGGYFSSNYVISSNVNLAGAAGTTSTVAIQFSSLVAQASFAYATDGVLVFIQAFNGATPVDFGSLATPAGGIGFWGFSGGLAFDRIEITSFADDPPPVIGAAAVFDNFSFTSLAAPAPELSPTQAWLPLLCAGLLLLTTRRTR